jgi:hypothetical protein
MGYYNSYVGYAPMNFSPSGYPPPSVVPQMPQIGQNQQTVDLIRVTGMEGARAYQMPPNSRAPLFDDTDDIVIFKMTDGAGFPSYRRARLAWIDDSQPAEPAVSQDYLTRKEFEKWKESFENGKQSVRKSKQSAEDQ